MPSFKPQKSTAINKAARWVSLGRQLTSLLLTLVAMCVSVWAIHMLLASLMPQPMAWKIAGIGLAAFLGGAHWDARRRIRQDVEGWGGEVIRLRWDYTFAPSILSEDRKHRRRASYKVQYRKRDGRKVSTRCFASAFTRVVGNERIGCVVRKRFPTEVNSVLEGWR